MSKYQPTDAERDELEARFTYHAPKDDQLVRYKFLRAEARFLAENIVENCPESRERSVALTKLDEVVMWANASIARRE